MLISDSKRFDVNAFFSRISSVESELTSAGIKEVFWIFCDGCAWFLVWKGERGWIANAVSWVYCILQIFGVVLFSVFSVVNVFTEIKKPDT